MALRSAPWPERTASNDSSRAKHLAHDLGDDPSFLMPPLGLANLDLMQSRVLVRYAGAPDQMALSQNDALPAGSRCPLPPGGWPAYRHSCSPFEAPGQRRPRSRATSSIAAPRVGDSQLLADAPPQVGAKAMRHVLHVTSREQLARMGTGRLDHPLVPDLEEAFESLESHGADGRGEAGHEKPGASRQAHDTGDDRASRDDDPEALG